MRRAAALSVLLAADDGAGRDYLLVVEDRIGPSCPIRVEP